MSGGNVVNPNPWYTPLFKDLIDNYNQVVQQAGRPNDQAEGYTISQLQAYLMVHPINWYSYRDYLQNNSSNPTEAFGIQLFNDYDF